MPIKILMPALSPTMTEGNLAKWFKKEGDKVAPGEVIAEIETDKATMEVEAVEEGIMGKIVISAPTENVPVNSLIALLLEDGEDISVLDNFKIEDPKPKSLVVKNKQSSNTKSVSDVAIEASVNQKNVFNINNRIFASPLARKIAEIQGIDLGSVAGSGPHGRIVKADLQNAKQSSAKNKLFRNPVESRIIPNNNVRKIIARRLVESKQTIPHFYLSIECNVDKLLQTREDINERFFADKSKKISVNDFVVLAIAKALKDVPEANSSWSDKQIHYYNNVDVSVAVAIEGGLITPVVKNADQKDILQISAEVKSLAARARENKLSPEEFQGGGFTVSNLGMYGIKNFGAIINPPQSCILAVGAGSKRAIVINDEIKIATIMDVTLSCDHRVVDGAIGANFLAAFKKYIEKPALMLV